MTIGTIVAIVVSATITVAVSLYMQKRRSKNG